MSGMACLVSMINEELAQGLNQINIDARVCNIRSLREQTKSHIYVCSMGWVRDPATGRAALNGEWEKMFPDDNSRPARHTLPSPAGGPALVTCDFVAVLG